MVSITNEKGSAVYVYLLALVAALGGLLFGYDTAVISGAIGYLEKRFVLNDVWKGWAASSALLGCIGGAAMAGALSDRLGRKAALMLSAVLFLVSAVWSAFPRNFSELIIARIIGGVGVGVASMLSPLYISEVAPAAIRGRLVSLNQFAIISGMLVVYFVNARIAGWADEAWNISHGWRWMFGSEILPACLFLFFLLFVPESPRWLLKQGREGRAQDILSRVGGRRQAQKEIAEIKDAIAREGGSILQLLLPGLRVALAIGVCLAVLQQITGINVVIYYAPEIFKSAGLAATDALNDTVIVGITNIVFTLVAIWIVDKAGRKPLLLIAAAGMGIALTLLGGAFIYQKFEGPWVLLFVLAYVGSFSVAMGPVVWVVMAEIFPTKIRGRAMSIATVCLWIANFGVTQFFPVMNRQLGGAVFFVYAVMCVIAFFFILAFLPETKGKTLEEIERRWVE